MRSSLKEDFCTGGVYLHTGWDKGLEAAEYIDPVVRYSKYVSPEDTTNLKGNIDKICQS